MKREQDRQAVGQVDQPLEQAADQEVQLAQAHQREDVGGEDQVRLLGEPVDRRDRVEREQQVGRAEREDHDEHRRDQPLAVLLDEELGAVPLLGGPGGCVSAELDQPVLLVVVLVAVVVLGAA